MDEFFRQKPSFYERIMDPPSPGWRREVQFYVLFAAGCAVWTLMLIPMLVMIPFWWYFDGLKYKDEENEAREWEKQYARFKKSRDDGKPWDTT